MGGITQFLLATYANDVGFCNVSLRLYKIMVYSAKQRSSGWARRDEQSSAEENRNKFVEHTRKRENHSCVCVCVCRLVTMGCVNCHIGPNQFDCVISKLCFGNAAIEIVAAGNISTPTHSALSRCFWHDGFWVCSVSEPFPSHHQFNAHTMDERISSENVIIIQKLEFNCMTCARKLYFADLSYSGLPPNSVYCFAERPNKSKHIIHISFCSRSSVRLFILHYFENMQRTDVKYHNRMLHNNRTHTHTREQYNKQRRRRSALMDSVTCERNACACFVLYSCWCRSFFWHFLLMADSIVVGACARASFPIIFVEPLLFYLSLWIATFFSTRIQFSFAVYSNKF